MGEGGGGRREGDDKTSNKYGGVSEGEDGSEKNRGRFVKSSGLKGDEPMTGSTRQRPRLALPLTAAGEHHLSDSSLAHNAATPGASFAPTRRKGSSTFV